MHSPPFIMVCSVPLPASQEFLEAKGVKAEDGHREEPPLAAFEEQIQKYKWVHSCVSKQGMLCHGCWSGPALRAAECPGTNSGHVALSLDLQSVHDCRAIGQEVAALPVNAVVGFIKVSAKPFKASLATWASKWVYLFTHHLQVSVLACQRCCKPCCSKPAWLSRVLTNEVLAVWCTGKTVKLLRAGSFLYCPDCDPLHPPPPARRTRWSTASASCTASWTLLTPPWPSRCWERWTRTARLFRSSMMVSRLSACSAAYG